MKKILALASLALALLVATTAQASSTAAEKFYIAPEFGIYGASQDDVSTILTYGLNAGFFAMDGLSIGGEFLGYYATLNNKNSWWNDDRDYANGFGMNLLVRYHPIQTEQASMYIGTGIGGLFMDERMVEDGEYSHVTLPVDVGFTLDLTDQLTLDIGGRYQRIGFTNDGIDAWGGNVGLNIVF